MNMREMAGGREEGGKERERERAREREICPGRERERERVCYNI